MAQLKNLDKIWKADNLNVAVTVGNNRTITRTSPIKDFECRLHGHVVARVEVLSKDTAIITLDTCGWLTTTTMAAMRDFMSAFGIRGNVSRAGGEFSARWIGDGVWRELESLDNQRITFAADRH